MADSKIVLGPRVRLEGITLQQLPTGGKGVEPVNAPSSTEKYSDGSGSTAAPSLTEFVKGCLTEAIPFIDAVAPKDGSTPKWKVKGSPSMLQ